MNHQSSITNQYLFVLGRETELCFAELETILSAMDPAATIQNLPSGVTHVQFTPRSLGEVGPSGLFDPDWWIGRLGGTRLIAQVVGTIAEPTVSTLEPFVSEGIRELALSSPTVSARQRMKLLLQLKNIRPGLRYRPTDDAYLVSGLSERLLRREDGLELLLIKTEETPEVGHSPSSGVKNPWIIAEVVAVQDTRAWTERDMGLPAPDAVVGMLPPKLARIMVNLAESARHRSDSSPITHHPSLLDPFCGSGQIPIEALRIGWTVTASDIDPSGIERTKTNLAWAQERSVEAAKHQWTTLQSDIATLMDHVPAGSVDAIVTEPDLGPPLRSASAVPSPVQLEQVAATIRIALRVAHDLLRSGGRLVIVIPIIAGQRIADRLDERAFSGYSRQASLHYARPDSRVEREIFVLDRI